MNDQLAFHLPPATHRDDPGTSARAERKATRQRQTHALAVLAAVRARPGLNALELVQATGLREYQVRRRLSDLRENGAVRREGEREGNSLWWAT